MCGVRSSALGYRRDDLPRQAEPVAIVVSGYFVVGCRPRERHQRLGQQGVLRLKSYEKAWTWLHKQRRDVAAPRRSGRRAEPQAVYSLGSHSAVTQPREYIPFTLSGGHQKKRSSARNHASLGHRYRGRWIRWEERERNRSGTDEACRGHSAPIALSVDGQQVHRPSGVLFRLSRKWRVLPLK